MAWGYDRNSRKGLTIMNAANRCEFSLITDSEQPTRIGNSISRNTTPDLCFVKNADGARWSNTELNLSSDHYMLTFASRPNGTQKRGNSSRNAQSGISSDSKVIEKPHLASRT
ncbi:hypothetical protein HPB49_024588 [Dermacentor silvarum]|uniref:Uncharacterized protein n=1 Tax=Dermacentor silvarum TaxID=543639 RepID=A0ACB8D171_DERSI|nr:hypothetical protein HPB49_024588 [Dermacentor silvarum]